jgi:hypothetical protein
VFTERCSAIVFNKPLSSDGRHRIQLLGVASQYNENENGGKASVLVVSGTTKSTDLQEKTEFIKVD